MDETLTYAPYESTIPRLLTSTGESVFKQPEPALTNPRFHFETLALELEPLTVRTILKWRREFGSYITMTEAIRLAREISEHSNRERLEYLRQESELSGSWEE